MLSSLLIKMRCKRCPYRKECHADMKEVTRMEETIKSLKYELKEYELELQKVQIERDKLAKAIWSTLPVSK